MPFVGKNKRGRGRGVKIYIKERRKEKKINEKNQGKLHAKEREIQTKHY
jgi:hypothetical protein